MGRMKDLGQQLKDKLDWVYEEESRKLQKQIMSGTHPAQHLYEQGLGKQRSTIVSNMRGVDDPNKREAYAIPLSRLVDMWRIKFEDKWIDVSELDEEFWADASGRLHRNKLMEEVEFNGSNTPWARLKEDA
jgi:hypothetical protein